MSNESRVLLNKITKACEDGNLEELTTLLAQKIEASLLQYTAFNAITKFHSLEILKLLFQFGFDGNYLCIGENLLHLACRCSTLEIIEFLLSKLENDINATVTSQQNAFLLACGRRTRANESVSVLKRLYVTKIDINCLDEDGNGALHTACYSQNNDVILYLLSLKDLQTNYNINKFGDSVMHIACRNINNLHVIQSIYESLKDHEYPFINIVSSPPIINDDYCGYIRPKQLSQNDFKLINNIEDNNNPSDISNYITIEHVKNAKEETIFHCVCSNHNLEIVKFITTRKGINIHDFNDARLNGFLIACKMNINFKVIRYLREQTDIDVRALDFNGQSALYQSLHNTYFNAHNLYPELNFENINIEEFFFKKLEMKDDIRLIKYLNDIGMIGRIGLKDGAICLQRKFLKSFAYFAIISREFIYYSPRYKYRANYYTEDEENEDRYQLQPIFNNNDIYVRIPKIRGVKKWKELFWTRAVKKRSKYFDLRLILELQQSEFTRDTELSSFATAALQEIS